MATVSWSLVGVAALIVGVNLAALPRRGAPTSLPCHALSLLLLVWTLGYVGEIESTTLHGMMLAVKIQYLAIPLIPVLVFWFSVRLTARSPERALRSAALSFVIPLFTIVLAWTNDLHGLLWTDAGIHDAGYWSVVAYTYSTYFWVHSAYSYVCLIAAFVLVIELAFRTSGLWFRQMSLVAAAMTVPWIANFIHIAGISPFGQLDPTPFAFGVTGIAMGIATFNFRLFSFAPVGRDLILGALAEGVVVFDHAGRVVDMNVAAGRILGVDVSDSLGRDARSALGRFQATFDAPTGSVVSVRSDDGSEIFECSRIALPTGPDREGPSAVVLRNVTELAEANVDLRETRTQLEAQLRHAQRLEPIGTYVGEIAHDFNNLLSAILGFSEMAMLDMEPTSAAADDVRQVQIAGERAKKLVSNLLSFGRKAKQAKQPMCLAEAIGEVEGLLRSIASPDIELVTSIQPGIPVVVADSTQIQQVLMNLCVNATHAMPLGGRLDIEVTTVAGPDPVERPGRWVSVVVRDTGTGMDQETLGKAFDAFFTTKSSTEGTGLGLSVVKGIVTDHEGELSVVTEPGIGTEFTVLLPAKEPGSEGFVDTLVRSPSEFATH